MSLLRKMEEEAATLVPKFAEFEDTPLGVTALRRMSRDQVLRQFDLDDHELSILEVLIGELTDTDDFGFRLPDEPATVNLKMIRKVNLPREENFQVCRTWRATKEVASLFGSFVDGGSIFTLEDLKYMLKFIGKDIGPHIGYHALVTGPKQRAVDDVVDVAEIVRIFCQSKYDDLELMGKTAEVSLDIGVVPEPDPMQVIDSRAFKYWCTAVNAERGTWDRECYNPYEVTDVV